MKITFKITSSLLENVRTDLHRPHPFAHERVGFISAGLAGHAGEVYVLAHSYRPVADGNYLNDPSVGAMMGSEAIRKAQEWALLDGVALFHVHSHGGAGIPKFSSVDLRENQKFVPDFLKVAPQCIHGAIVLTNTAACGQYWRTRGFRPSFIDRFVEVGIPMRKWSSQ